MSLWSRQHLSEAFSESVHCALRVVGGHVYGLSRTLRHMHSKSGVNWLMDTYPQTDEQRWPSVKVAYDFVLPSYQLLTSRFEAADTRLTTLLTFMSTLTLAAPIFGKNVNPDIVFATPSFLCGMGCFVLGAVIGVIGRVTGNLVLPDPMVMYEKSLHRSEWEFKKNQIDFAGQNFQANADAIREKGNVALGMTLALLLEVICFTVWLSA
jgi:hypothetical protein